MSADIPPRLYSPSLLAHKLILALVLAVVSIRWRHAHERDSHCFARNVRFGFRRNLPGAATRCVAELQKRERPELHDSRNGAERKHGRAAKESSRGSASLGRGIE